jgi:hypothetical protein
VALRDGVVGVVGQLRAADYVAPVHADFVAGFDVDYLGADGGLKAGFAGHVGIVDVADCRVVSVCCSSADGYSYWGCWRWRL